jgi:hypothetical protein
MPGAHRNLQFGPDTYKVSAAVLGGQLVEADASNPGLVKPAAALSKTVMGVALGDAAPVAADASPLVISSAQPEVAVQFGPADVDVTYTGACLMGAMLIAGAAGTVTTYVTGTNTYDQIVGRCTAPVSGAGLGRARLFL